MQLYTDDTNHEISKKEAVEGVGLVGCLLVVHVPEKGHTYGAWHVAGMDLAMTIHKQQRQMFLMISRLEVDAADSRISYWRSYVRDNPGKTYLCGPNADVAAMNHFNIVAKNTLRTEQLDDGITVRFDPQTTQWSVP